MFVSHRTALASGALRATVGSLQGVWRGVAYTGVPFLISLSVCFCSRGGEEEVLFAGLDLEVLKQHLQTSSEGYAQMILLTLASRVTADEPGPLVVLFVVCRLVHGERLQ